MTRPFRTPNSRTHTRSTFSLMNSLAHSLQRMALRLAICLALLLPQTTAMVGAAPARGVDQAPATQAACPAGPSALPNIIDRTEFCVRYDSNTTAAQATTVADLTQQYWDRYDDDLGFRTPLYSGKLVVEIRNNANCNGATDAGVNYFYVNNGCFSPTGAIDQTVGHELFHRVQLASGDDLTAGLWLFEGTARLMEDLAFDSIDNWANALTAPFSFNQQAGTYLNNTNIDITSFTQRYNSALWWKFFSEQFGQETNEPERGVDAIVALWEAAETDDDIAAVNAALSNLGALQTFDSAFRRFVLANWTKDLAGQPDGSYNYFDEDEAANPGNYGAVLPADGGTISAGTPAAWTNQLISRYGASYYMATPGDNCPVVNATVQTSFGPAFYHVVTESGGSLVSHEETSSATDWSRNFYNNGLDRIGVVVGSTDQGAIADVTIQCLNPELDIRLPNNVAVAHVGPHDDPGKLLAQVLVTDGSLSGPVIAGFMPDDFVARINGIDATITTGAFIQEQYWLQIQAPPQTGDGTYSLEIILEESGTSSPIASNINAGSVLYSPDNLDHALVIDRSGSMTFDGKLQAAKDAANFYVDITRDSDGIAVVPFTDDATPTAFPMQSVTAGVRANATSYINGLTSGNATSIGDGLQEAANQRNGSPTGNPDCSFVLLSDGIENSDALWADVQGSVIATGCPVTTIAFGASSDETLMQEIATATGGSFFYNDVYVSPNVAAAGINAESPDDTALELGSTYEYAQGAREGRQRLMEQSQTLPNNFSGPIADQEHRIDIDASIGEVLFALKWNADGCIEVCKILDLKLQAPDGKFYNEAAAAYTFKNIGSGYVGWRIANPVAGTWRIFVNHNTQNGEQAATEYKVLASAHTNITAELLLPDRLGSEYFTGNHVPIYALLSGEGPLGAANVRAQVTAPDDSVAEVQLYDDGQHGDGAAGDGFYAGIYTLVNQAELVTPPAEAPPDDDVPAPSPKDEGSYLVRLLALQNGFRREARGSFSVEESPDENQNRLPDVFEEKYGVTDPGGDEDLDGLNNYEEYQNGTDPLDSDTDDGGENDGSEVSNGLNPLDPSDDKIDALDYFEATPIANAVRLRYHVRDDYAYFLLYRSTNINGPWTLINQDLTEPGEYVDGEVQNGTEYFYRLVAVKTLDEVQATGASAAAATIHYSAVKASTGAVPSADPYPPEARILINGSEASTDDLLVLLSFVPYEDEEYYNDITEMKVGHTPDLAGASWQPFAKTIEWQLSPVNYDEYATVYAQFRDGAGNVSLLEQASIRYVSPDATPTPTFTPTPPITPTVTPTVTVTPDPDAGAKPLENLDLGLRRKAEQFLEDMRGNPMAPGWDRARLGNRVRDLYRPDMEEPAYQEFQVLGPDDEPAGFIVISNGDHDLPIPHWNFEGETPTEHVEREAAVLGNIVRKFFKLDSLTYAGERADGKLAALVGNNLIKVDGLDPNILEDGLELTHESWRPEQDTENDGEIGGIGGNFDFEGPTRPEDMVLDGWETWEGLTEQFSETYEILTGSLDRESERDWEIDREAEEEGEGLFAGIQYSITLITEDPPTVTIRGEGVDRDLFDSVVITRPDLPALLELNIEEAIPDIEVPFEVELDFGDRREELEFNIIDRSRLPTRFQLVNDVFLPVAFTEPRRPTGRPNGVNASAADEVTAPGAEERQFGEWTFAWAGGHGDQRLYEQIPSSHSSNSTGCVSGSGATSWAMLFGWADKQAAEGNAYWQPRWGLYRQDGGTGANIPAPGGMNDGIRSMIWEIYDAIGTWCAEESQPSPTWNMEQAAQYFIGRSGTQLDTYYNVQGLLDPQLREYVIESIRDRGTPAIIGTGWLNNYALAYGYAWRSRSVEECDELDDNICWEETEYNHLFYINRGDGGADNGWVSGNTWFVGEIRP